MQEKNLVPVILNLFQNPIDDVHRRLELRTES